MLDVKLSKYGGNSFVNTKYKETAVSIQMKHTNLISTYYLLNKVLNIVNKISNR